MFKFYWKIEWLHDVWCGSELVMIMINGCRYKIYVEGNAWSVSEKYILACDSPVLFVTTLFQDILSRALVAGKHYWPINREHVCKSIKFAVD